VLATFLTWMQEKTAPVFVVATANSIEHLPPELLRRGRLDETFFVDLPNPGEREAIFEIHLAKRNRSPELFDLKRLAAASEGFSGAEIEQCVIDALFEAYSRGAELNTDFVDEACRRSIPLSRTMQEPIERLRNWAKGRAQDASRPGERHAQDMSRPMFAAQTPGD
jgi:SpoVK/Ycf46/Vps4 family AAA+-type ATPase